MKPEKSAVILLALLSPLIAANLVAAYRGHPSLTLIMTFCVSVIGTVCFAAVIQPLARKFTASRERKAVIAKYSNPPEHASPQHILSLADKLERQSRVEDLLSVDCPVCQRVQGMSCDPSVKPVALIDREEEDYCHYLRMQKAVAKGFADRLDVIDQWGSELPEEVSVWAV